HYLFAPDACTPAAGWEKGQVERQVNVMRNWLFVPRLKFLDLAALNVWLEQRCGELATERQHPDLQDQTIATVFEREQPALGTLPPPFDGYAERHSRVSSLSLVTYERNRYSVPCTHVGRTVSLRIYADQLRIVADGKVLTQHLRLFGRYQTAYDPWHYVPALERKPGALRNGAPFVDWDLPAPIKTIQARLMKRAGGDRQCVQILAAIPVDGFEAVTVACAQALEAGVISADYVLNTLNRLKVPPAAVAIETPDGLRLQEEPKADVARYDRLLRKDLHAIALLVIAPLMNHFPPAMIGVNYATA
ncbi:MAG: Mu transposase domain-containing protein, partial [Gammaproteobacteria bacterium]